MKHDWDHDPRLEQLRDDLAQLARRLWAEAQQEIAAMDNPYRTPADIEGADDTRPFPPAPLEDYLEDLRREHADLPFVFQPFPTTIVGAIGSTIQITVAPQREGRLVGVLFEPRCAPALRLVDLKVGHESLFHSHGAIPCELLTLNAASTPEALQRLSPTPFRLGNRFEMELLVLAPCEIAGTFVCDPACHEAWAVRELHAKLKHYEHCAARDIRMLAELTREIHELRHGTGARRTEPAPAPVESNDGGAWMTPTDES